MLTPFLKEYDPKGSIQQMFSPSLGTTREIRLSSGLFQHLIGDADFTAAFDPNASTDKLERGLLGTLYGATVTCEDIIKMHSDMTVFPGLYFISFVDVITYRQVQVKKDLLALAQQVTSP